MMDGEGAGDWMDGVCCVYVGFEAEGSFNGFDRPW